jgi:hypothetical protein
MRVGYGGTSGPLSNINQDGFAAASFHSWPNTLKWDGISGDYGPGFLGMALGSGTYVVDDPSLGLVAYGGVLESSGDGTVTVQTRDPVRRRVYVGPLGMTVTVDAGIIEDFSFDAGSGAMAVTLTQMDDAPVTNSTVLWVETPGDVKSHAVVAPDVEGSRLGWRVPLSSESVKVDITPK